MICIGHRGAAGHAPENTVKSVLKAVELGARRVEVDVYCIDGRVVVFHDERLERSTTGTGYIFERKFDDLRRLDAGDGQKIPTLEEVFEAVDRRAGINVELKGWETGAPVAEIVSRFRSRGWSDDLILVSSFNHRELKLVRRLDKQVKIGVSLVGVPIDDNFPPAELDAYSVHQHISFINRRFLENAHSRNLRVFVFTVNHPEDILRMKNLGVDGVFTDYPERVLETASEKDGSIGWK